MAGGNVTYHNHFSSHLMLSLKLQMRTAFDLTIPLLGIYPIEIKSLVHMCESIHCSKAYHERKMETSGIIITRGIAKSIWVQPHHIYYAII